MTTKEQEYIEFNQNFDQLVYIKKSETPLAPSPMKGVMRMILERRGDEVARRATSVVTYEPGSSFSAHVHAYGEEYFVLQGTFSDHTGDFSKGWYVRNPIKSSHAPFSKQGTKIFVKLGQMPINESEQLRLNTNILDCHTISEGVSQLILYESPYELVLLYKLNKGVTFSNEAKPDISEIFVIEGPIRVREVELETQSWIRIPKNSKYEITALQDSKIYVKIGKGIVRDKQWNQIAY